jgi:hypothetical protein
MQIDAATVDRLAHERDHIVFLDALIESEVDRGVI